MVREDRPEAIGTKEFLKEMEQNVHSVFQDSVKKELGPTDNGSLCTGFTSGGYLASPRP